MAMQTAIKRLSNDYKDIHENPIPNISAKVREHFAIILKFYLFSLTLKIFSFAITV